MCISMHTKELALADISRKNIYTYICIQTKENNPKEPYLTHEFNGETFFLHHGQNDAPSADAKRQRHSNQEDKCLCTH